ncbi:MAG TPA: LCP family protein, partial [Candidatus Limnocylindrales bacterium]|nr:LCP family protein [Candidatus Limnocylindrales bacterium]
MRGRTDPPLQSAPTERDPAHSPRSIRSPTDGTSSEGSAIHRPLHSNRHVAALLSSLWPGLGQLVLGARRAGWLLAAPPLILLGIVVVALATRDKIALLALFLDPNVIGLLLSVQVLILVWRLLAVGDAFRRGQGAAAGAGSALTAIALVFVLVPSVFAGYLTEVAREAAQTVFAPSDGAWNPAGMSSDDHDIDFGTLPPATAGPIVTAPPALGRFTVLLIGADSGPDRSHALTDTMIVASLDPVLHTVSMVSVPRDLVDAPLPDGRTFHPKINELMAYVNRFPQKFPGAASGEAVLASSLGLLLNVHIDGWAQVNLPGFVKVIDAIGGVDVTVRDALCDYRYREYGYPNGFAITPGNYHMNGITALAYARIRHSAGESDFTRAARQGEIVVAARDRLVKGGFLNDPAALIESMGELLETSLDPSTIGTYLPDAVGITRDHIYRAVIQYPLVHGAQNDPRGSVLIPRMNLISDLAARAFPPAGTLPTGLETIPDPSNDPTKTKLPRLFCSAPPKATDTPTAAPTVTPTS